MPTMYVNRYGYPRRQCLPLTKLTRLPPRPPAWRAEGEDLVYVSSASQQPRDVAWDLLAPYAASPGAYDLVSEACRRMIDLYETGRVAPDAPRGAPVRREGRAGNRLRNRKAGRPAGADRRPVRPARQRPVPPAVARLGGGVVAEARPEPGHLRPRLGPPPRIRPLRPRPRRLRPRPGSPDAAQPDQPGPGAVLLHLAPAAARRPGRRRVLPRPRPPDEPPDPRVGPVRGPARPGGRGDGRRRRSDRATP